ncbi:MAG: PilN domain-containing protein, partial [Verrucomicrobiota bacterium]
VLLPKYLDMTSFSYKKAKTLTIRGVAQRADPVYDYVEALERSALFLDVKPDIKQKIVKGKRITEFQITAALPEMEES